MRWCRCRCRDLRGLRAVDEARVRQVDKRKYCDVAPRKRQEKRWQSRRLRGLIDRVKRTSGGCVVCGETHIRALDFHHVDPRTKRFAIAASVKQYRSPKQVLSEMAKCVLLCATCHRKVEADSAPIVRARRAYDERRDAGQLPLFPGQQSGSKELKTCV